MNERLVYLRRELKLARRRRNIWAVVMLFSTFIALIIATEPNISSNWVTPPAVAIPIVGIRVLVAQEAIAGLLDQIHHLNRDRRLP